MGGVCGIGSIKGRLSPIESLSGTLSIPVGGILDCDIYDGEYTVTPSDTVQSGLAGKSEVAYEDLAAALKTLIDGKAEQTTVNTMIGNDTGKSIRAISAEEVAKIVAGADENYNTLKEIADWIMSDTTGAAKMANDITRLDTILDGIGDTTDDEQATVVAYVQAMIDALGIGDYVKTTVMNTELAKKVDKVDGSRLMTTAEGTKLASIAEGAQVNVIEKIKVNGVEQTVTEKAVDVSVPTGALASLDKVTEENLDSALKAKVNAAAEGNHSHANKTVLDGITSEKVAAWDAAEQNAKNYVDGLVASDNEVTAICTEVFGTASA